MSFVVTDYTKAPEKTPQSPIFKLTKPRRSKVTWLGKTLGTADDPDGNSGYILNETVAAIIGDDAARKIADLNSVHKNEYLIGIVCDQRTGKIEILAQANYHKRPKIMASFHSRDLF